jgi:hypothetical protein
LFLFIVFVLFKIQIHLKTGAPCSSYKSPGTMQI